MRKWMRGKNGKMTMDPIDGQRIRMEKEEER